MCRVSFSIAIFSFELTAMICFFLEKTIYDPPIDHTYGSSSGHYLLFDQRNQSDRDFTIGSTKKLLYNKHHCLQLWYYHDGERPIGLTITAEFGQRSQFVGEISSSLDTRVWQQVRFEVQHFPHTTLHNSSKSSILLQL